MPCRAFQLVFGPDDEIQVQMLDAGRLRTTRIDLRDAPFSADALAEPEAQAALKAWLEQAERPVWICWEDVEDALVSAGLNVGRLAGAYHYT